MSSFRRTLREGLVEAGVESMLLLPSGPGGLSGPFMGCFFIFLLTQPCSQGPLGSPRHCFPLLWTFVFLKQHSMSLMPLLVCCHFRLWHHSSLLLDESWSKVRGRENSYVVGVVLTSCCVLVTCGRASGSCLYFLFCGCNWG